MLDHKRVRPSRAVQRSLEKVIFEYGFEAAESGEAVFGGAVGLVAVRNIECEGPHSRAVSDQTNRLPAGFVKHFKESVFHFGRKPL